MDYYYAYEERETAKKSGGKPTKKESFFEWIDVVVASVIAVVFIFTFLFRIVTIDGDSMLNTLVDGERVIITNVAYTPKRGDIVVISRNTDNSLNPETYEEPIIKGYRGCGSNCGYRL